jgi:ubiquitin carboxyl-terminal hydrolase 34
MAAQDLEPENWSTHKGKKVDDNVFHQLQKMFGSLEFTDRQEYNPEEFCFSYKDWDGIPVKIGE